MSSIGDKKVALNLSDGTSVNLNKPKVLPADITSFTQITDPGWYIGGLLYDYDKLFPNGTHKNPEKDIPPNDVYPEVNFVITDGPDFLKPTIEDKNNYYFYVLMHVMHLDSPVPVSGVPASEDDMFVDLYANIGGRFHNFHGNYYRDGSDYIEWTVVPDSSGRFIVNNLTTDKNNFPLSAKQGKVLKDLVDNLGIKTIDSSITDLASITESGTYIGATNFDKTDTDDDGKMYYTSSLKNWPGLIINGSGAVDGAPYILRVTNVKINTMYEQVNCTYYELLWLNYYKLPIGKQKAHGINSRDGYIDWINDNTGIEDSLASHSTESALSANQGRVLNDKISKLTKTDTVGSASNPVYMKNGTITAGAYTFSASTTDLTAGTSTLATNEIRFIYE